MHFIVPIKDVGCILPTQANNLHNSVPLEHFKVLFFGRRQEILVKKGRESRVPFMLQPGGGKKRLAEQFGFRNADLQGVFLFWHV